MIRLRLSVGPTDKIPKEFMRGDDVGEREALRHLKLERPGLREHRDQFFSIPTVNPSPICPNAE